MTEKTDLNFLYLLSEISKEISNLDSFIQDLVDLIYESWPYPGLSSVRVVLNNKEFQSNGFIIGCKKCQKGFELHPEKFCTNGKPISGKLELVYPDKRDPLPEEDTLINEVLCRVNQIIYNYILEVNLKKTAQKEKAKSLKNHSLLIELVELKLCKLESHPV